MSQNHKHIMRRYGYSTFLLTFSLLAVFIDESWKGAVLCWYLAFIASASWFIGRFSDTNWLKNWLRKYF